MSNLSIQPTGKPSNAAVISPGRAHISADKMSRLFQRCEFHSFSASRENRSLFIRKPQPTRIPSLVYHISRRHSDIQVRGCVGMSCQFKIPINWDKLDGDERIWTVEIRRGFPNAVIFCFFKLEGHAFWLWTQSKTFREINSSTINENYIL